MCLVKRFHIFVCFGGDFIVKNDSQVTEMLSSVPKCKKTVMGLLEKMHALDKLRSGMSYSAVGCVFNVNELTVYSL